MLFARIALNTLAGATAALALSVKQPHVSFTEANQKPVALRPISSQFKKADQPIIVQQKNETLEFNFVLEAADKPQQASLAVGSTARDVEIHYSPIIKDNDALATYKFKIPIERLPESLLYYSTVLKEPLTASLILASKDGGENNIFVEVFDLDLAFDTEEKLSLPPRFGKLPEITHTFNSAPKTVSAWFAQVFCLIVVGCVLSLLLLWLNCGILSSLSLPKNSLVSLYLLGFVGSIFGMEYVFTQYYLGTSIFKTLENAFYVCLPGFFIGCKLLQSLS